LSIGDTAARSDSMCEIFIRADPESYASRTRSVRLHGVVTSLRLENLYWDVLEEIGRRDGLSVAQLLARLYDELVAARGEVGNFASFLRVCALRYMALVARGRIPADLAVPVRSLDPDRVLDQLPQGWAAPRGNRSGARHHA
jgi:predicted DNA-binding ribbon-helix-helix protein